MEVLRKRMAQMSKEAILQAILTKLKLQMGT